MNHLLISRSSMGALCIFSFLLFPAMAGPFEGGTDAPSASVKRVATNSQEKVVLTGKGRRVAAATPDAVAFPTGAVPDGGQNQGQQDSTAYMVNKDVRIDVDPNCDDLREMLEASSGDATDSTASGAGADLGKPNKFSVSAPFGPQAISAAALNAAKAQAALKEKLRKEAAEKKMTLYDVSPQGAADAKGSHHTAASEDPLSRLRNTNVAAH